MPIPWLPSSVWGPILGGVISGLSRSIAAGYIVTKAERIAAMYSAAGHLASIGVPYSNIWSSFDKLGLIDKPRIFKTDYLEGLQHYGAITAFKDIPKDVLLTESIFEGTEWTFPSKPMPGTPLAEFQHKVQFTFITESGEAVEDWITVTSETPITRAQAESKAWGYLSEQQMDEYYQTLYGETELVGVEHGATFQHYHLWREVPM